MGGDTTARSAMLITGMTIHRRLTCLTSALANVVLKGDE